MRENIRFVMPSKKYDIFAKHIAASGYPVYCFQKYDHGFMNGIHMLGRKFVNDAIPRIYDDRLINYGGIYIIFDALVEMTDLIWLKKNNPNARCVLLIWNPVSKTSVDIDAAKQMGYEVWSYGKQCAQYHMKENLYFYCESMYEKALQTDARPQYDIIFAGKDKGRMDKIKELINQNGWQKLKWNLYFTPDHFWQIFKKKEYRRTLDYEDVQMMQANAKAIMELMPAPDADITMRTLDSLILKRKLITDAKEIKERDYYNPNNVFVIGDDPADALEEFLNKPYVPISEDIVKRYTLDEWVKRIVNDTPVNEWRD